MLKCSSERWVCAPHSLSAGTLDLAEAVGLLAYVCHGSPLWFEGADSTSRDGPKKVPN